MTRAEIESKMEVVRDKKRSLTADGGVLTGRKSFTELLTGDRRRHCAGLDMDRLLEIAKAFDKECCPADCGKDWKARVDKWQDDIHEAVSLLVAAHQEMDSAERALWDEEGALQDELDAIDAGEPTQEESNREEGAWLDRQRA